MRDYFEDYEILMRQEEARRSLYTQHDIPVIGTSQITLNALPHVNNGSRQVAAY